MYVWEARKMLDYWLGVLDVLLAPEINYYEYLMEYTMYIIDDFKF